MRPFRLLIFPEWISALFLANKVPCWLSICCWAVLSSNWLDETTLPCWFSNPLVIKVSIFSALIVPCWLFNAVCVVIFKLADREAIWPAWLLILSAFSEPSFTIKISPDWFWISEAWSAVLFNAVIRPAWLSSCFAFKLKSVAMIPCCLSARVLRLSKVFCVKISAILARILPCLLLSISVFNFSVPFCAKTMPPVLFISDWLLLIVSFSPRLARMPFWFWIPCFTSTCASWRAISLLSWLSSVCAVIFIWLPLISLCLFDLIASATKLTVFAVIKPLFCSRVLVCKSSCDCVRISPWWLMRDAVFTVALLRERIFPLLLFKEFECRINECCAIIPLLPCFSNKVFWLLIDWLLLLIAISFAEINPWLLLIAPLLISIFWAAIIFPCSFSKRCWCVLIMKERSWLPIVPFLLFNVLPVWISPFNFAIIWLSLLLNSFDVMILRSSAEMTLFVSEFSVFAVKFNVWALMAPFCWFKLSDNVISACLTARILPSSLERFFAFKVELSCV